jgi:hypothetical protein
MITMLNMLKRQAAIVTSLLAGAALLALAWPVPAAHAQNGSAASAGPIPRTAEGRPDLSGVWWRGADLQIRPLDAPAARPATPAAGPAAPAAPRPPTFTTLYQPWAMARRETLGDKDDPTLRCVPVAFGTLNVSLLGVGFVGQIVQTPNLVVMLTETFHAFRLVPTDGRPHRDDALPSPRGDSIGRWEGDTLVVDQTNFTDTNWMFAEGNVSFHSDALHIVERYRMLDADRLQIDAVIEDPKVLTGPWTVPTQTLVRAPFDQIMEVGCSGTETHALMEAAAKQNYGK